MPSGCGGLFFPFTRCATESARAENPQCGKNAGKHPRTANGFEAATCDAAQIRRWWQQWPDANIGLPTGAPSGVDVLDVDVRNLGDESLHDLERKHGEIGPTVISLTGGGGSHVFFRHETLLKNSAGAIAPGLDLKTTGGYVVLPPSVHVSGRAYIWEGASRPDEVEVSPFPGWLLALIRQSSNPNGNGTAPKIPDIIPDGTKHNTCVSLAGTMRRRGCEVEEITAALVALSKRFQSPVPAENLRRIAENACQSWRPDPRANLFPAAQSAHSDGNSSKASPGANGASARAGPASRGQDDPDLLALGFHDRDNAQRLIALKGEDMRYCHAFRKWLLWDGRRWSIDCTEQARKLAQDAMLEFLRQAVQSQNEQAQKFARQSLDSRRLTAMLHEAEPHLVAVPDQLDTHPDLLNFRNGTVDLRTGELRPHTRTDLITKLVDHAYISDARCPTFMRFLFHIMGDGPDACEPRRERADRLVSYLRRHSVTH